MAYFIVKKYVVEECQVEADTLAEAKKIPPEDPFKVTVVKQTIRRVKSDG